MIASEACDCMHTNNPVTINALTNAKSYRVVKVYPYGRTIMAKLIGCHVDYNGKAVDINKNDIVTVDVKHLCRVNIKDYDNY